MATGGPLFREVDRTQPGRRRRLRQPRGPLPGEHWRPRRSRRRMTVRGRLTLAAAAVLIGAPLVWAWGPPSSAHGDEAWRAPVVVAARAGVAPRIEADARGRVAPQAASQPRKGQARAAQQEGAGSATAGSAGGAGPRGKRAGDPPQVAGSAAPPAPAGRAERPSAPGAVERRGGSPPDASARAQAPPVPDSLLRRLPPTAAGRTYETVASGGAPARVVETVGAVPGLPGPVRVETTLHPELVRRVDRALRAGRVGLGQVVVMDPRDGRVLAYQVTDPERLPADALHPAASLMKIVTAAAVLEHAPAAARRPCRYAGSPWRLTRARLDPPAAGRSVSMRRALATSNNQCFARLAVHDLGSQRMLSAVKRLGLLEAPAPGLPAGRVDAARDPLSLGKLGCGLAGCEITALAAARLAGVLAHGRLVEPRWIERVVDGRGRELAVPAPAPARRVVPERVARELRTMLVDTTLAGTARRAFRTRRGPLLGDIRVAGKTGSLNGRDPNGRYEWFVGVAPADDPQVAVATLVVQNDLWWISSSQLAAEVLKAVFCPGGVCREDNAVRWTARGDADGSA